MTDSSDFTGLVAVGSVSHDRGLNNHREDPPAPVAEVPAAIDTETAWRNACAALFTRGRDPDLPTPDFEALVAEVRRVRNARVIGDGAMARCWEALAR
jgi:hypothetical protein